MKSEIIKSKRVNDGVVKLFKFSDGSGVGVSYSVIKTYQGINIVGSGAAKIKEIKFLNGGEALNFFDSQT